MFTFAYRRALVALGTGVLIAASVLLAPAWAQDADKVKEVANYHGEDRQAMLEAGAKAEGKLVIYTTGTQIDPLVAKFHEKYPFIAVEQLRASASDIARRVFEEYRAGYFAVDGFELSAYGLIVPRDNGALLPFYSPEAANFPDNAKETNGNWIVVRESYPVLGYNTKLVAEADVPKTFDDLLDPKWKGKMAVSGSLSTTGNWIGSLVISKGADFVRQLKKQDIRVYEVTGRALANLLVSGEVAISPNVYDSHILASRQAGAPVAWRALGPVTVTDTSVALASRAPHPHAMMLFADFLMSKEGQEMYKTLGYSSPRTDMQTGTSPKEKIYLSNRPNYIQEFEEWSALFKEVFLRSGQ